MSTKTPKACENCNTPSEELFDGEVKNFHKNHLGKTTGNLAACGLCMDYFSKRDSSSKDILTSTSEKRLIVAGPGTGKTFTFGKVIEALPNGSSALVFTLINNLADELEKDLSKLLNKEVKVNTLHGYCKEILHSVASNTGLTNEFTYTPLLPTLIEQDAVFLGIGFSQKSFGKAFANIDENDDMSFYLERSTYYNAASHIDSVYRVYKFFDGDADRIPSYAIVIADEYQDFNKLEAGFISLLAQKSHALVAGDDDQALYGFREAKKEFIQKLHNEDRTYENKYLPFCSRCTPVIVDSTKKVIKVALGNGLLQGRIPRDFISYWPEKYKEHAIHPCIYAASCSQLSTVPKYIEKRILDLVRTENPDPNGKDLPFMIIGPESGFHLDKIKEHLLSALDQNIFEIIDPRNKETESELLEAYKLLRDGLNLNLAWRIILHVEPLEDTEEIIRKTHETEQGLVDLLPKEYVERHLKAAKEEVIEEDQEENEEEPPKRIRILLTNFLGSKGLAALHVVVVGLNNYTFPVNPASIKDEEVCKFVVALTRAKNSCALVMNKEWDRTSGRTVNRPSVFLSWLPQDKLKKITYKVREGNLVEG